MNTDIQKNLVFLSNGITNLGQILLYLEQNNIFSGNECEEINNQNTTLEKASKLLTTIQRKDWLKIKDIFLEILRNTNNDHCANKIEGISLQPGKRLSHPKVLKTKWWPDKKILIESLHKRSYGDKLLVEELHERILSDNKQMVVICETADASKLTGMGGVGKTLTAKWYAHHYEEQYDHILWIDCGEALVLQSFKCLARELDIKNRNELMLVEEFSREIYKLLQQFKCLWIFDNAEFYLGEEGIQKLLPKYETNFYCLITSRSKEWGTRNVGFGKISDLALDIFNEQESLEFLKANISPEINCSDYQLRELCHSLSSLPLALQLAVASLNNGKIDLQNYIEKSSSEDLQSIVETKFDDYEKTININIKISLDLIAKEKYGKSARKMLMIFGYIRPDNIESTFLLHILNSTVHVVRESIDLLHKYSLISKTRKTFEFPYGEGFFKKLLRWDKIEVEMDCLSIHRLLQQVLRHHGREKARKTLRKILGCKGFVDYKLIPFMKFADENLKKEFPTVKTELLDQEQLKKLLREKRFEESAQLSKYIDDELKTNTTKFNYSICLFKNGQLEECITILEELVIKEEMKSEVSKDSVEMGILKLEEELSEDLIAGHLLAAYWRIGKINQAQGIIERCKLLRIPHSKETWSIFLEILNSDLVIPNYSLTNENSQLNLRFGGESKVIGMKKCPIPVESNSRWPEDLTELNLILVQFQDSNGKKLDRLDLSNIIPQELKKLTIMTYMNCILTFENISSVDSLIMWNCSLKLDSVRPLSPQELELWTISFIGSEEEPIESNINQFFDFNNIKRLTLVTDHGKNDILIDLSEDISVEYLKMQNVRVLDWKEAKWTVQKLKLSGIPLLEKSKMKIKQLQFSRNALEMSCLPQTLEQLSLYEVEILANGEIHLPNLKYLTLRCFDPFYLSHFHSVQLTCIHFYSKTIINTDLIPTSVSQIKITFLSNKATIYGGLKKLNKLILEDLSSDKLDEFLTHFETRQLIVNIYNVSLTEMMGLINRPIKSIAIGNFRMEEKDLNKLILSKIVDRKSEFYLFEMGQGRGIEEEFFKQLVEMV